MRLEDLADAAGRRFELPLRMFLPATRWLIGRGRDAWDSVKVYYPPEPRDHTVWVFSNDELAHAFSSWLGEA